jgi:hypothetical protein
MMRDRRSLAIVGAGLTVALAMVVVVLVAIVPTPTFDDFTAGEATGWIAYTRQAGSGNPSTLTIVDLGDGTTATPSVPQGTEPVGWDDDGNLLAVDYRSSRLFTIDPADGSVLTTVTDPPGDDPWDREPDQVVWWEHRDGRMVLERGDGGSASFPAPDTYEVTVVVALGDDRFAFVDELGRLAVTRFGTDVTPMQVADDAVEWARIAARP